MAEFFQEISTRIDFIEEFVAQNAWLDSSDQILAEINADKVIHSRKCRLFQILDEILANDQNIQVS